MVIAQGPYYWRPTAAIQAHTNAAAILGKSKVAATKMELMGNLAQLSRALGNLIVQ
jgi:hypothetical protein